MRRESGEDANLAIVCQLILIENFVNKFELSEGECPEVMEAKRLLKEMQDIYYCKCNMEFNQVFDLINKFKERFSSEMGATNLEE